MKVIKILFTSLSIISLSVALILFRAFADSPPTTLYSSPQNFNLEAPLNTDGVPLQWGTSGEPVLYSLDKETKHGGDQSVKIVGKRGNWVTLTSRLFQRVSAEKYRNKRTRFSAWIKSEDVDPMSSIWIAAFDKDDAFLKSDTLMTKPDQAVVGTKDWRIYSVEIEVPENAFRISLGFEMASRGTAWLDDLSLEVLN